MTVTAADVSFDMYDREIYRSPYSTYRLLQDEAPLYFNEQYDFFLVSRFDDVGRVLGDRDTFSSAKGPVYNIIASGSDVPEGLFIGEDPPQHGIHRAIVSRLFTPRAVGRIEPDIHALFHGAVEALVGEKRFDFMKDFAIRLPIQVISMLFGVPKSDHETLRAMFHKSMNEDTADPEREAFQGLIDVAVWFTEYLDYRAEHPTDDLMTELLNLEFEDETGATRRLRREEIVTYLSLIIGSGSDTTGTGIGWAASLLAEHPDQRRLLVEDPSLIPNAVEEILRFEPPSYHIGRVATRDVDIHDVTVPEGGIVISLPGAANRDERQFENADRFDIRRPASQVFSLGFGPHYCLGASLAKLEMRIAIEAVLQRIPEWTIDEENATLTAGIDIRGWNTLPIEVA